MSKILIVDDDESIRRLLRLNLTDLYEVFDTGKPEEALALALEHKPDAVLLDLRMPGYSGFELCKTLTSFSATQLIPVFIISGEGGAKTKEFCRELGASAYFEKPVNFESLRSSLAEVLRTRRIERRKEKRVGLRVPVKLAGKDASGNSFSLPTTTENVSADAIVDVDLLAVEQERVGKARVVRAEWPGTQYPRYALRFTEISGTWILK
jgi:DNA-binding response OmpR family regulator